MKSSEASQPCLNEFSTKKLNKKWLFHTFNSRRYFDHNSLYAIKNFTCLLMHTTKQIKSWFTSKFLIAEFRDELEIISIFLSVYFSNTNINVWSLNLCKHISAWLANIWFLFSYNFYFIIYFRLVYNFSFFLVLIHNKFQLWTIFLFSKFTINLHQLMDIQKRRADSVWSKNILQIGLFFIFIFLFHSLRDLFNELLNAH